MLLSCQYPLTINITIISINAHTFQPKIYLSFYSHPISNVQVEVTSPQISLAFSKNHIKSFRYQCFSTQFFSIQPIIHNKKYFNNIVPYYILYDWFSRWFFFGFNLTVLIINRRVISKHLILVRLFFWKSEWYMIFIILL